MISSILLAAGQSKRMDGDNKLIKKYKKKYLINHILGTLIKSKIDKIIVVVPENRLDEIDSLYPNYLVIPGGKSRRESSYKGLIVCHPKTKKVLIHDAARALIDADTIGKCIKGLESSLAVSTVIPIKDTIVETTGNKIVRIPKRDTIFCEQTPQGFDYQTLLKAHHKIKSDTTDDIYLVKQMGIECNIIEGSEYNFKINDLSSRLKSFYFVEIKDPDDKLLNNLFMKLLNDKQIIITNNEVFSFITKRIHRTYLDVYRFVEKIDKLSLEKKREFVPDAIMWLQPTQPFRNPLSLKKAFDMLNDNPELNSVIGVGIIYRDLATLYYGDENLNLTSIDPFAKREAVHRQQFRPIYISDGTVYVMRAEVLRETKSRFSFPMRGIVTEDPVEICDIDYQRDLEIAEAIHSAGLTWRNIH